MISKNERPLLAGQVFEYGVRMLLLLFVLVPGLFLGILWEKNSLDHISQRFVFYMKNMGLEFAVLIVVGYLVAIIFGYIFRAKAIDQDYSDE